MWNSLFFYQFDRRNFVRKPIKIIIPCSSEFRTSEFFRYFRKSVNIKWFCFLSKILRVFVSNSGVRIVFVAPFPRTRYFYSTLFAAKVVKRECLPGERESPDDDDAGDDGNESSFPTISGIVGQVLARKADTAAVQRFFSVPLSKAKVTSTFFYCDIRMINTNSVSVFPSNPYMGTICRIFSILWKFSNNYDLFSL